MCLWHKVALKTLTDICILEETKMFLISFPSVHAAVNMRRPRISM